VGGALPSGRLFLGHVLELLVVVCLLGGEHGVFLRVVVFVPLVTVIQTTVSAVVMVIHAVRFVDASIILISFGVILAQVGRIVDLALVGVTCLCLIDLVGCVIALVGLRGCAELRLNVVITFVALVIT